MFFEDIFRLDFKTYAIIMIYMYTIIVGVIKFMSRQAAIRLPDETFDRLQELAKRTGRTTTYYIREAIQEHLEDLEDIYFSEMAIGKMKKGEDEILESKEFWHGLES